MPLVSVVIPTIGRPKLLLRAVGGVLGQTHSEVELIVVVDGCDPDTVDALRGVRDRRLHVVQNPQSLTAAGARNAGIERATGDWLAFLDDDDEWLPQKLARQLAFAAERPPALITCLSRVVTTKGSFVRPKAVYDNRVPIDEYLFDRRSPFGPTGFIQTSSYLIPRRLVADMRFRTDTPHDDWDLLLRLCKESRVRVETVLDVLVVQHLDHGQASLSATGSWSRSLSWADRIRALLTDRAYAGFCLGVAGSQAAAQRDAEGCWAVLRAALTQGSPRLSAVAAFLALCVVPRSAARTFRGRLARAARSRLAARTPAKAAQA